MTELANVTAGAAPARRRRGILTVFLVLLLGGGVVVLSAAPFPAAAGPLPFGAEAPQGEVNLPLSSTRSIPRPTAALRATRCVKPPAAVRATPPSRPYHVPAAVTVAAAALRPYYDPQAPPVSTL